MTSYSQLLAILDASNTCARYEREPSGRDTWQTPAELAASGVGDCEDFAIDAMFRVIRAELPGVARLGCCARSDNQVHMVCLYYPLEATDPWVLDIAVDDVCRLSERPDLTVLFELGVDGIYVERGKVGPASQNAMWASVLTRMADEQPRCGTLGAP